ncbi:hypothetical protein ACHAQE_011099 [Botrytis cinerea]
MPGAPVLSQQQAPTPPDNFAGQELIELGLQEALPAQELMDELHHIFFAKFYPVIPMIHEYRYYTSLTRAPLARPPICLSLEDLLYGRARRYLDASEIKGEGFVTIYHAQTWCLIAMLEAKNARFSQSWMSVGRAVRLVQMLGLYALDAERGDAKQVLPPAEDWIELEERRRTFWTAFYGDRWASVLTGWPTTINENEILTNLPVSELSFRFGLVEETNPFTEAFSPRGLQQISPFSALLLATKLYGHNREHLNTNSPNECFEDVENGEFWKHHRRLDNALLNTFLYLPDSLRLPHGMNDMNTAFVHVSIHASSINLHQGAIAAAMKHGIDSDVIRHSQVRTLTAAQEITNIMQQIDNVDVTLLNSWTGFCLYVAAGVLIKDQQSDRIFGQGLRNLNYLLSAMQRIGQQHKITEHFYRQTRRDITAAGLSEFGEGLIYGYFPRPNSTNPISSVDDSRSDYRQFSIPEQTLIKQKISDPRFEVVEAMWDLPIDYPLQFSNLILSTSAPRIGTQRTSTTQDTLSIRSIEKISDSIPGSSTNSNQNFHT